MKDSVDMGCWYGAFTECALSEKIRESFLSLVQKPADEYDDQDSPAQVMLKTSQELAQRAFHDPLHSSI